MILKNRHALSCHTWRVHSNRERPSCDTCHRVLSSSASLRGHIDTFHKSKERPRLPCAFLGCKKSFLNKGDMAKHVKIEHSQHPVRFPCTLCGKTFKTWTEFQTHIPTHTTEKPYNCATCGMNFARRGDMKSHEMTHLEKSTRAVLQCHVCPQAFLTRAGLQNHVRVSHENQRNYPCTFCDKRFSFSRDLKRHVDAKHAANNEPIHSCDKCEYRSYSKHNLALHARRHKAARYGCYFCGEKFVAFRELVKHFRIHTLEN
ncbi:zinc finger protein 436 [Folsomia candida]|uniref:zinc finger protein 436 n=1 Tax=Folsomia candida TaxID=158441 RepID=UPI001604D229|nr:zinc finger protein 436 [Folsomia candida]